MLAKLPPWKILLAPRASLPGQFFTGYGHWSHVPYRVTRHQATYKSVNIFTTNRKCW